MGEAAEQAQAHVMVVAYPAQGHINPMLHFAKCLAIASASAMRVTFVTSEKALARMSMSMSTVGTGVAIQAFGDGLPPEFNEWTDFATVQASMESHAPPSLRSLLTRLNNVTCIVFDSFLTWVPQVGHSLGLPCALFWTQSTFAFCAYRAHRAHADAGAVAVLAAAVNGALDDDTVAFDTADLPSFVQPSDPNHRLREWFAHQITLCDHVSVRWLLINSCAQLEPRHLAAAAAAARPSRSPRLLAVGPLVNHDDSDGRGAHMWRTADCSAWLDSMPRRSVVYVSFGSMAVVGPGLVRQLALALMRCGRPFLWVLRKSSDGDEDGDGDGDGDGGLPADFKEKTQGRGMVVTWAAQMRVLSHGAIGAFVSHCGWNSTVEALSQGVPMICVPQCSDQTSNAAMISKLWKAGVLVRTCVSSSSSSSAPTQMPAHEFQRCLNLVFDDGEGASIRRNARVMRHKLAMAIAMGMPNPKANPNIPIPIPIAMASFVTDLGALAANASTVHCADLPNGPTKYVNP